MLQTKALYNLLRLNADEDPSIEAEAWALENLRCLTPDQLFARLKTFGVQLDKIAFHQFADSCDTPEELTEILLPDHGDDIHDPFYLHVFELWRQLVPEKQSLSIFCDELDFRITQYYQQSMETDELIQDALANLLEILDENVDAGEKAEEVFTAISSYCAQEVEDFIYDYVSDLLDTDNPLYASELIDDFSPYITEPFWFTFLQARLLSLTDIHGANVAMQHLLDADLDLSMLIEMLRVLSTRGEQTLFIKGLKKALLLLTLQDELTEVMVLVADYYRCLDEENLELSIQERIDKRDALEGPLDPNDSDFKALQDL